MPGVGGGGGERLRIPKGQQRGQWAEDRGQMDGYGEAKADMGIMLVPMEDLVQE